MKRLTTSTVTVTLAALVLLLGGVGVTVAATGGTFLLGKSNSATTTTTLSNSRGTALSLSSRSGTAPLKVNRTTKVTNLNADLLDGLSGTSFQRRASGSCATGIRSLGSTGTPSCVTPLTVFATPGNHAYTVPAGVHLLHVRIWAGGGGASQSDSISLPHPVSGSGGGQGSYVEALVPVQPGDVLIAAVGAGGIGQGADEPGSDGGESLVSVDGLVKASAPGGQLGILNDNSSCTHGGGGPGGAAGTVYPPTIGLTVTPGAAGGDGTVDCTDGTTPEPGGQGGGRGLAGAGADGYSSDTYFQGPNGADGLILIDPAG